MCGSPLAKLSLKIRMRKDVEMASPVKNDVRICVCEQECHDVIIYNHQGETGSRIYCCCGVADGI